MWVLIEQPHEGSHEDKASVWRLVKIWLLKLEERERIFRRMPSRRHYFLWIFFSVIVRNFTEDFCDSKWNPEVSVASPVQCHLQHKKLLQHKRKKIIIHIIISHHWQTIIFPIIKIMTLPALLLILRNSSKVVIIFLLISYLNVIKVRLYIIAPVLI